MYNMYNPNWVNPLHAEPPVYSAEMIEKRLNEFYNHQSLKSNMKDLAIRLKCNGYTNKQIAKELNVSESVVLYLLQGMSSNAQ